MKKRILHLFFTFFICTVLMAGCSFFEKEENNPPQNNTDTSQEQPEHTGDSDDVPVVDFTEEQTTEETTTEASQQEEVSSNPRENVAKDKENTFTAIGKYCGFIDSNSVEVELEDGSYCSFFVYKDKVRDTLSSLDEEQMYDIEFTYQARDGQINPEMIVVYVK